jgi:hypothetical protein
MWRGGQLARAAGAVAKLIAKEVNWPLLIYTTYENYMRPCIEVVVSFIPLPFQNVGHFDKSKYIVFAMHLYIVFAMHLYIHYV